MGERSQVMKWCIGLRASGRGKPGLASVPLGGLDVT